MHANADGNILSLSVVPLQSNKTGQFAFYVYAIFETKLTQLHSIIFEEMFKA